MVIGAGVAGLGFGETIDNPAVGGLGLLLIFGGIAWMFRGRRKA
jgi:hypothetical protein